MGIYNNYAHFTSFFLICRALLLLWLMTKESYKHFQHSTYWDEGSGDIKLLFNILIFLILTGIVAEPRSSLFSWLFPCSKSLQHHLSRLLINKSQITWSEKVSKHVDQNFIRVFTLVWTWSSRGRSPIFHFTSSKAWRHRRNSECLCVWAPGLPTSWMYDLQQVGQHKSLLQQSESQY